MQRTSLGPAALASGRAQHDRSARGETASRYDHGESLYGSGYGGLGKRFVPKSKLSNRGTTRIGRTKASAQESDFSERPLLMRPFCRFGRLTHQPCVCLSSLHDSDLSVLPNDRPGRSLPRDVWRLRSARTSPTLYAWQVWENPAMHTYEPLNIHVSRDLN